MAVPRPQGDACGDRRSNRHPSRDRAGRNRRRSPGSNRQVAAWLDKRSVARGALRSGAIEIRSKAGDFDLVGAGGVLVHIEMGPWEIFDSIPGDAGTLAIEDGSEVVVRGRARLAPAAAEAEGYRDALGFVLEREGAVIASATPPEPLTSGTEPRLPLVGWTWLWCLGATITAFFWYGEWFVPRVSPRAPPEPAAAQGPGDGEPCVGGFSCASPYYCLRRKGADAGVCHQLCILHGCPAGLTCVMRMDLELGQYCVKSVGEGASCADAVCDDGLACTATRAGADGGDAWRRICVRACSADSECAEGGVCSPGLGTRSHVCMSAEEREHAMIDVMDY